MSLATFCDNDLSVCSLFYVWSEKKLSFVVASSFETTHIKHIQQNSKIAGNILLETKEVGKIQGLQFKGEFLPLDDDELKSLYFKAYPYALAMLPTLWQIRVNHFKLTDNRLGIGKKLIWQDESSL